MKLTDMLISTIIKKGILYEARNIDVDFDIPTDKLRTEQEGETLKKIKVHVKVEHMSIQIEKEKGDKGV